MCMDLFPSFTIFVDQMIKEKYGTNLLEPELVQMRSDLLPRLNQWILLKAMTEIGQKSPEKLKELTLLANGDTPSSVIITFIQDIIPDTQTFLTQTLLSFKQTYLDAA